VPIRIGRLQLELHQRAIHLTRGPHPECPTCAGHGGIEVYAHSWAEPETELCDCWDPAPVIRLPLALRRNTRTEEYPF
jgi:hypothetical protein